MTKPLIGLSACLGLDDGVPAHIIDDKYIQPVALISEGTPLILPALGSTTDYNTLLDHLSGLVLTGSASNVHPDHFGTNVPFPTESHAPFDAQRDQTILPLIQGALKRRLPILAICRGHQELNVALGGSLTPAVHERPGAFDHRDPKHEDRNLRYGPRHPVSLTADGILSRLLEAEEIHVNSLHTQAIEDLASELKIEAQAKDGTIEAVSLKNNSSFCLGVQWHPEYNAASNPVSRTLFKAFGQAAANYRSERA